MMIPRALLGLATNAAKYGAFSKEHSRVEISWRIDHSAAPMFEMTWQERDGPIVVPPSRLGFGQTVMVTMVRSALNGDASLAVSCWRMCCRARDRSMITRSRRIYRFYARCS